MASRVLGGAEKKAAKPAGWQRRADPAAAGATVLIVIGAAFAMVGAIDLILLWMPSQFGEAAWEFGTLSRTFASVPMGGLGVVLVAYGLLRHDGLHPGWVRVAAVVVAVIAVLLVLGGALFGIAATSVIGQTPPQGLMAVRRATIKGAAEATIYTLAFATVAVMLWKSVRRVGGK